MTQDNKDKTFEQLAQDAYLSWLAGYDTELLFGFRAGSFSYQSNEERISPCPVLTQKIFSDYGLTGSAFGHYTLKTRFSQIRLIESYFASPSKDDKTQMRILKGPKYLGANREGGKSLFVVGKPAKIIKKILPGLSESQSQEFALWWRDIYCQDTSLELHTGKGRSDFKAVYTGERVKDSSFSYEHESFEIKSLNGSCLRHTFGSVHPSEAYASGQFKIIYTKDREGLIHSRCVVLEKDSFISPAPIYSATKAGTDKIADCLKSWGKPLRDYESAWDGAELLYIETEHGVACPYLDCRINLSCEDGELMIDSSGEYDSDTSGYIQVEERFPCEECGDSLQEDYLHTSEYGNCYCESCYSDLFFICEMTDEEYPTSDRVTFIEYGKSWGGGVRKFEYSVCESWAQGNGVIPDGESDYYSFDLVVEVEDEYYLLDSDDIFKSDKSGDYFLVQDKIDLPNGEFWSKDELESDIDCPWQLKRLETDNLHFGEVKTETVISLKDNYELDQNGIPQKNPTLPL